MDLAGVDKPTPGPSFPRTVADDVLEVSPLPHVVTDVHDVPDVDDVNDAGACQTHGFYCDAEL